MSSLFKLSGLVLAALTVAAPVGAQELAGAPETQAYAPPAEAGAPEMGPPEAGPPDAAPREARFERRHGEGKACYAQVRYPASYAPPPTGPEYVWRQAPAPPGAPGPVWCLTVQPFPNQAAIVAPARLGWIRVLCADDATPERVSHLQRRLHERGLYRGEIDGRYDEQTAYAVSAFQQESHIEHRGYLSYETLSALDVAPPPPPRVVYLRRPSTFERGYVSWPGKARYW